MKIEVTQKHIDEGYIMDGRYYPIALAVRDKYFIKPFVDVGRKTITIKRFFGLIKKKLTLPDVAQTFVKRFDAEQCVNPLEFYAYEVCS